MSGTLNNIHNNVSFALNLHYKVMARLQEQAYTGSRINRASDDPSAAYQVLALNSQKRLMGNYMDNISEAISALEISLSTFAGTDENVGIKQTIAKTKILLSSISGTSGEVAENVYKEGIKNYLEEIISFANWKYGDQYLFGGSNTSSAPYTVTRDSNGNITSVTYQGSSLERNVEVSPGVQSSVFYAGDDIFRCHDRGDSEFVLGHTGAQAGTGTARVTGYSWFTVAAAVNEKQTITIAAGPTSGNINIAFGTTGPLSVNVAFDADADDVEDALETLGDIGIGDVTCTGTSFADGGITIEFTGALALTNVAEMVVTDVDLDPAETPAISTDTDGGMQLSIDGGTAVGIPIGDKTNVAVTNPAGKVLYVNAEGIDSTGVELVSNAGTHDIFNMLITISKIFENENNFTSAQLTTMRDNTYNAAEELSERLSETSISMGMKINFLETLKSNLENIKFNVEDKTTLLQETDIARVAIDLSRREVLYQMSLSIAGRLMSMSLLDFI